MRLPAIIRATANTALATTTGLTDLLAVEKIEFEDIAPATTLPRYTISKGISTKW